MQEQVYGDMWIRWAPETWKAGEDWATSIQLNTLCNKTLAKALFILRDYRCVFGRMEDLRRALDGKSANSRGTIAFRLNPQTRMVNGTQVNMDVIISRTYRRRDKRSSILDNWNSN